MGESKTEQANSSCCESKKNQENKKSSNMKERKLDNVKWKM